MKMSLKIFAYVTVASVAFLACNDANKIPDDDNATSSSGNNAAISSSSEIEPVHNVTIADDVQKWMEEQLASKGDEKREIWITDLYVSIYEDVDGIYSGLGLSVTSDLNGKVTYFLYGKEISAEKYNSIVEERRNTRCRRNLEIPGIGSTFPNCINWTSLMTAEELAELLSKGYDYLDIYFYIDPTY